MNILEEEIITLARSQMIPFVETDDYFDFRIEKSPDLHFSIKLLKNGTYIFLDVGSKGGLTPMEHIEFYNEEDKKEVLEELENLILLLSENEFRISEKISLFKKKRIIQMKKEDHWQNFGYPDLTNNE